MTALRRFSTPIAAIDALTGNEVTVMRIRLMGTHAEIAEVVDALSGVLDVQEVSDFYPNRGRSHLGRVYLEIAGVRSQPMRAAATRADDQPADDRAAVEGRRALPGRREGDHR